MADAAPVIAIGASAGGIEALMAVVSDLPASFRSPILVTVHIGQRDSVLPRLLSQAGPLPAVNPADGSPLRAGVIHVAPPAHHLLVEPDGTVRLGHGPLVHRTCPAVDPMFRSLARAMGPRAVGVVLSGALDDGTAGLLEIKRHGGLAIVQDPADAKFPGMPRSALRYVQVDHRLPAARMGRLFADLAQHPDVGPLAAPVQPRKATGILADQGTSDLGYRMEQPTALTCPLCGGAMRQTQTGGFIEYGCHIGHDFSAASFLDAQMAALDQATGVVLRTLSERAEFCRRMADTEQQNGHPGRAARWREAEHEAQTRAAEVRQSLTLDWLQPDPQHIEGEEP
jgi:two-component system chemotaxis response regulator CheB